MNWFFAPDDWPVFPGDSIFMSPNWLDHKIDFGSPGCVWRKHNPWLPGRNPFIGPCPKVCGRAEGFTEGFIQGTDPTFPLTSCGIAVCCGCPCNVRLSHSTDTLLRGLIAQTHRTDTILDLQVGIVHTTNTLLKAFGLLAHHTTNTLCKEKNLTAQHTSDTYTIKKWANHNTDTYLACYYTSCTDAYEVALGTTYYVEANPNCEQWFVTPLVSGSEFYYIKWWITSGTQTAPAYCEFSYTYCYNVETEELNPFTCTVFVCDPATEYFGAFVMSPNALGYAFVLGSGQCPSVLHTHTTDTLCKAFGLTATHTSDTYLASAGSPPTVTNVPPIAMPGNIIPVTGTNFSTATSVHFGGTAAVFTIFGSTIIQATVPTVTPGVYYVAVTNPYGTSPTGPANQITVT